MKQKIKNIAKILMIILLLHCIFNTTYVWATDGETASGWDAFWDGLGTIIDGVLSIFLYIYRLIPVIIGGVLQGIAGAIASIGVEPGQGFSFLTMENILFNEVPILRVNFFNSINSTGVISDISNNIATWYYALRNVAIILSLAVLIYVGIRMAISTIAEDKAKYKKMLMDWVVGFITIFLLHYIIVITVNVNDLLVGMFANSGIPEGQSNGLDSYALTLAGDAANLFANNWSFVSGMTSAIVYLCLVIMIFMFLFNYIKRMLTVAFLVIIAPIITVTYSIDKMGDGKSQALNTWLKEFIYNVLIQPFHCIIYLVFMTIILGLIESAQGLGFGAGVIAIVVMFFIKQAEGIVRKIFGFDNAGSLGGALASGALLMKSMEMAGKAVKGAKGGDKGGSSTSNSSNKSKPKSSNNANRNMNAATTNPTQNGNANTAPNSNANTNGNANTAPNSNASPNGNTNTAPNSNANPNANPKGNANTVPNSNASPNGNANTAPNLNANPNGNANTTPNSNTNGTTTQKPENKKLEALKKFGKTVGNIGVSQLKGAVMASGAVLGGFAGGDPITGGMTGINFGKALNQGGETLVGGAITLKNKATTRSKQVKTANNVIDTYDNLKAKGWDNDTIRRTSESILQVPDASKIRGSDELKQYAQALHSYRGNLGGEEQERNQKVLDTIDKIQTGEVTKQTTRKYTRKLNK